MKEDVNEYRHGRRQDGVEYVDKGVEKKEVYQVEEKV